jgi:hypothetical protein
MLIFLYSISALNKNRIYILLNLLILICEIYARIIEGNNIHAFWGRFFQLLSFLSLAFWYYQMQKDRFFNLQKWFLVSLLVPILTPISDYFFVKQQTIFIIIIINIIYFSIWISVFKAIGAKLTLKNANNTFLKLYALILSFPLIYFLISVVDKLSPIFLIAILILYLLFSYTSLLSIMLPISDNKRKWIILGLTIFVFQTILFSYNYFLLSFEYGDIYSRILIVISKCMVIYGMIDYDLLKINRENIED